MNNTIYDILKSRELIKQITFEDEFKDLVNKEKVSLYLGIDPTADSIHIGHFIPLMMMSYFQKCGHRPIILIGGGTALIGDPSGKTDMRKMLTKEDIQNNVESIKKQVSRFISFENENKAIIVNNADWLLNLNYLDFISKIGVQFNVNRMLAAECFKQRMENGLTFFELNYMIMQSYDFLHLFENENCKVEIGGDDQWSNMLGGVDLIRKMHKSGSFCLTCPLLLNSEGKKMGKTVNGALWLNKDKTSVYDFYQYWRNISDSEVYDVLRMLTFLPMEEVKRLSLLQDIEINEAKKTAAFEITKLIHGEEEANIAKTTSEELFENFNTSINMPTVKVNITDLNILDILIKCGLTTSKGQGKILVSQGGILINDEKINDINYVIDNKCESIILKKGKKIFIKIIVL
ncbi:MAG: tyrosine--tRNA ligase [Clostridia bacterium]|nr:tyrosine--tRNA ligase [Clostridia bacterium]MDD4386260.1 tyrosine--tRNA ligase [Clostridia bacterium]